MLFKIWSLTPVITIAVYKLDCFTNLRSKRAEKCSLNLLKLIFIHLIILHMIWRTFEIRNLNRHATKYLDGDCFVDLEVGKSWLTSPLIAISRYRYLHSVYFPN